MNARIVKLCLFGMFLFLVLRGQARSDDRPNIILIMADDLGFEAIGANGGETYHTPHLDKLAETGARFEHCYSQPLCTPSRLQIMTGKYNVRNYRSFGRMPRSETTFANILRDAGYRTCIAGKWQLGHEADAPKHFGFDESLLWYHTGDGRLVKDGIRYDKRYANPLLDRNGVEETYTNNEYGPDLVVDFICDFMARDKEQPFLVYYPMILTHGPYVPTPKSKGWDVESLGDVDQGSGPEYFDDMVAYVDDLVGRIVDELERQGLRENTILLFTTDNGTGWPMVARLNGKEVKWGKGKTTDAGTRVPLIVNFPDRIEPQVIDDLVDFTDFFLTLRELAEIDDPIDLTKIDGRSFLPQLEGKEGNPREFTYCWFSRSGEVENARVFARNHRYKLYQSGDFYDISNDVEELNPIADQSLSSDMIRIKDFLTGVIQHYEQVRLE